MMVSTDIDGTPILILGREEIVTIADMLRWIHGDWSEEQKAVLLRMDKFLVETGDATDKSA
jgi:hypothetical protein